MLATFKQKDTEPTKLNKKKLIINTIGKKNRTNTRKVRHSTVRSTEHQYLGSCEQK